MVDIDKLKIRKKIYRFEPKQRYQHVRYYKVKEKPPIEKIKEQLRNIISPPRKEEKKEPSGLAAPKPAGFNFAVFGAAILIAIIILAMGWIVLSTSIQEQAAVFKPQLETPSIQNSILGTGIMNSGTISAPSYTASVDVDYHAENLKNYTIRLTPYEGDLPSEVFLLNTGTFEATGYSDFVRSLRIKLAKRQVLLNELSINQLETIPDGAIVVVPSGVIPTELLGFGSSIDFSDLADRGVVMIYMGQPFTKMLNGTLVMTTPQSTVNGLPFTFDTSSSITTSSSFTLYQPLYRVTSRGRGWSTSMSYGSVSVATRGDGAVIFLPQTLNGGWRSNYTAAADSVATIIFDIPWADTSGGSKEYVFTNQTLYSGETSLFSEPFDDPDTTMMVEFIGYSAASDFPIQQTLFAGVGKSLKSKMYIEKGSKVVPTNITNTLIRINAMLKEPVAAQPSMYLIFTDANGTDVQIFSQGPVNVQADRSIDVPVYVERGEYTIRLVDDESNVYAQTYMKVVGIDIKYVGQSQQKASIYNFNVLRDGSPVTLAEVKVEVDNGQYGTYTLKNVDKIALDLGSRTSDQRLPDGDHTFKFTSTGLSETVTVTHTRYRTIFDDPLLWVIVLLTLGIVGVGVVFARQESIFYALDVPDFPPVTRTKVPLSPDTVLGIFQKINENYRWETTPLTTNEIKNGFKDIFYKGRPIYITDYNVEFLLDELIKRGKVKESLGYYGLTGWEEGSRHSMVYLAMMRRLRDICVNNAVPFTGIDESKEADSVITVVGQQMYLHFFDSEENAKGMLGRLLSTIGTGITIVLFKNDADKESFESLINSSPTAAPIIVKMEADSKSLLFHTPDELQQMLQEFKAM